jgi:Mce-associated membrane protein
MSTDSDATAEPDATTESDEAAEPDETPTSSGTRSSGSTGHPWRVLAMALAVTAVAACVLLFTERQREDSPSANRALVDAPATTKAVGDVSNALVKIFSYEHGDVAATEKAAADLLEGKAADQYRALFAQVKQQAPAQRLTLTTRIVRAGVSRMSGDTAHLLVFLDQVSTRNGKPAGGTAAAQLAVTAGLRDGHWRITEIRSS